MIIKCKVDEVIGRALKDILDEMDLTQQELLEQKVKEFVLENMNVLLSKSSNKEIEK